MLPNHRLRNVLVSLALIAAATLGAASTLDLIWDGSHSTVVVADLIWDKGKAAATISPAAAGQTTNKAPSDLIWD